MPISRRRSATMYDSTPYVPTAASRSARPAKPPSELRQQTRAAHRLVEHRVHLAQADDGHRRIRFAHGGFDGLAQRRLEAASSAARRSSSPGRCRTAAAPGCLIDEEIELRARLLIDAALLDVLGDADRP